MPDETPAYQPSKIASLLPEPRLTELRRDFDMDKVADQLEYKTPALYEPAQRYFSAVVDTFFEKLPYLDGAGVRVALEPVDRQRCILALQAATGQTSPLAIHIYIGLMLGLTVDEIANILLLAGVYTGVPNFFTGLGTLATTLQLLAGLSGPSFDSAAVLQAIQDTWKVVPATGAHPSFAPVSGIARPTV